ncbi:DDE transposase [Helicobacter bizzozeronii]|nr:DDE transposase [Helicobacter bizzozeronii]
MPRFLILGVLCGALLCAKTPRERELLPLPPAKQIVVQLEEPCNESCLQKLYEEGQIFSFMARFSEGIKHPQLQDDYKIINDLLNPPALQEVFTEQQFSPDTPYQVALLVPKKVIGRYSNSAINAILAYLSYKNHDFIFKVFDSQQEDPESLKQTYQAIEKEEFPFVIALLTQNGVENLIAQTPLNLPTIIPTVHKNQLEKRMDLPSSLLFGGIDFFKQVHALLDLGQHKPLVVYNDDSFRGEMLGKNLKDLGAQILYEDTITFKKASTFSRELRGQAKYLKNAVVFFNTPIVKTGLLLSQISRLPKASRPAMLLSSQINFNLSMFMLTQPRDRTNFYLTSAIGKTSPYLSQYASILNTDLQYDWVSYASLDSLDHMLTRFYANFKPDFSEPLQDRQIIYTNTIYTPKNLGFAPEVIAPTPQPSTQDTPQSVQTILIKP